MVTHAVRYYNFILKVYLEEKIKRGTEVFTTENDTDVL